MGPWLTVILENASNVPHVLLEYKRPVADGGETSSMINFLTHYKQLINYASQIMFEHPEITLPPIILTGSHIVRLDSFYAGRSMGPRL